MAIRVHEREREVTKTTLDIETAVFEVMEKHKLTDGETIRVLSAAFHSLLANHAKYMIRMERHGDPDKPGGQA